MKRLLLIPVVLLAAMPLLAGESKREAIARGLLISFNAGQFDLAEKHFNESLKAAIPPKALAALKTQVDGKLGKFHGVTEVKQGRSEDGFPFVELISRFEKSPASLRVVFDGTDHVGAVSLNPIMAAAPDPKLEQYARDFLNNFVAGQFDAAAELFDATLRAQLTTPRLRELSEQVHVAYGQFRSVTGVQYSASETFRDIELTAMWDLQPMTVRVVFNHANRIAGVTLTPMKR